jgi:hypothetical protein
MPRETQAQIRDRIEREIIEERREASAQGISIHELRLLKVILGAKS